MSEIQPQHLSTESVSPEQPVTPEPALEPGERPRKPKNPYRAGILGLCGCGIVGAAGLVGWWAYGTYGRGAVGTVAVTFMPVQKGDVEITVTESGTVELGGQQTLKAPREATVEQVHVKEGDRVRVDQALLILRDRKAQDDLKDQQVETAKLFLELKRNQEKMVSAQDKLQRDQSTLELERTQQKITEVQSKLKAATARYKESQEFFTKGYISATDVQTDQDKLDSLQSELRDAELAAIQKQQEVKTRISTLQSEVLDAQVAEQRADLDLRKGQEKLSGLAQQLSDRVVTTPINGMVLKLMVKNGDGVKTEANLITLGDPAKEMATLRLTTLNASKVRINQVARISLIGPSPKMFTGRVISLSPAAVSSSSSNSGEESGGQAKVEAKVRLDRPSNTLIPGSLVSVEIISDRRQQVIVVPTEAIQRTEGTPFVWLKDAQGKAKKQPVTLGLEGLQNVEIKTGLNLGDTLALAPPATAITPGAMLVESSGEPNPDKSKPDADADKP